jgi:hypothetical protein
MLSAASCQLFSSHTSFLLVWLESDDYETENGILNVSRHAFSCSMRYPFLVHCATSPPPTLHFIHDPWPFFVDSQP